MNPLNGRMRVMGIEGTSEGAEATFVPLRPPNVGTQWEIIWVIGRQNDGAVSHGWYWYDPEHPVGALLYVAVGALDTPLPLGALGSELPNVSTNNWWATYDHYPSYYFQASAAGKKGTVLAIVIERVGVG
ncbi:unnamed protein product [marine sediment metagenome]|uniref:Uncharacterized protein n=1 Tax=marine sediment metagenome TaxID=412755 RepID=X1RSF9_9ZZZZ